MRFILFNLAVGAALIYLFKGGELPIPDVKAALETARSEIAQLKPDAKPAPKAAPTEVAERGGSQGQGHGHDVIREPEPKPTPQPKPAPKVRTGSAAPAATATNDAPPLPQAKTVAARPEPKAAPKGVSAGVTVPPVPPAPPASTTELAKAGDPVQQRRDEVLGNGAPKFAIKAGTALMSSTERRRELDALAEEMEMLYIEKVGG